MRPEHEQRFRRIVSDLWRAEIRAHARRDKIRVVTFRDGDRAIAARNRTVSDQEVRYELVRVQALRELAVVARALGHEPGPWLRSDEESICLCSRCDARLYLRVGASPASDGEAIAEACPAPSCARITG